MRRASSLLRQAGLTLVEMMVAIAIVGILAAMAVQLGGGWLNSSKVSQGQATLQHAFSVAKSAALQNHYAVTSQEVSTALCLASSKVYAVLGEDRAAKPLWTGDLEKGVTVQMQAGQTCVGLSSTGIPIAGDKCGTSVDYVVAAGDVKTTSKKLY